MGKKYIVHSLERGLHLLEWLAARPQEWALSEIARELGFSRGNTHKLLAALKANNYVIQNPDNSKYKISLKIFKVGNHSIRGFDICLESRPIIKSVANALDNTVSLAVRTGDDVVCLEHADGPTLVQTILLRRGEHLPLYVGAAGNTLLAFLPEEERKEILDRANPRALTTYTVIDVEKIEAILAEVRERQYSLDHSTVVMGLSALAVPVYGASGQVVATLVVAGFNIDFSDEQIPKKVELIQQASKELSERVGLML
jgi:DNA-binding IclR family transcriptional regulator